MGEPAEVLNVDEALNVFPSEVKDKLAADLEAMSEADRDRTAYILHDHGSKSYVFAEIEAELMNYPPNEVRKLMEHYGAGTPEELVELIYQTIEHQIQENKSLYNP